MNSLKIDPEFKSLIPSLTAEEYQQLEGNILRDGCRDALKIWNGIIIDGHNRYEICQKHKRHFNTAEIFGLNNRDEVIDWIINNQLGRRNLIDAQKSYLRGLQYTREKKREGGRSDRNFGEEKMSTPKTSERLAEIHKVDEKTIRNDGKFAEAVDQIAEVAGEDVKRKILNKEIQITKKDVVQIVKETPKKELKEVFADITKPIKAKKKEDKSAVVAPGKLETERKEVEEKPPVSEVEQLGPVKIRAHKNEINENTGFPTSEALGFKPAKPQPIAKSIISNVSSIVQSFTVNLGFVIESEPVLAGLTVNDIDELLKHIRKTQAWLGTVENNFIKLMEEKQ